MKTITNLTVKIKTDVSLVTIIKWRLLGLHKMKYNHVIVPEGYTAKDSKMFKIEMETE